MELLKLDALWKISQDDNTERPLVQLLQYITRLDQNNERSAWPAKRQTYLHTMHTLTASYLESILSQCLVSSSNTVRLKIPGPPWYTVPGCAHKVLSDPALPSQPWQQTHTPSYARDLACSTPPRCHTHTHTRRQLSEN